ncbi:MAG: SDR family NAD(P)-dependent oxidoreductase [Pseudomonadota bacterium]
MAEDNERWIVITGSTGGIGRAIVDQLADGGRGLVLVNRSENKAVAQRDRIKTDYPDTAVEVVTADFMDANSIAEAIATIRRLPGKIDVLYNVAGVLNASKQVSAQGFESNFAVNALAPYQLILGLRQNMARPADQTAAVVVNFSSSAIKNAKSLELGNLENPQEVTGLMGTYAQSKLALTTLSAALADDLRSDNILVRAVDPGATKSPMTTQNDAMPLVLQWLAPLLFADPGKQATKVVASAQPTGFDGKSGIFIANLKERKLPKPAADKENQRKLVALMDNALRR